MKEWNKAEKFLAWLLGIIVSIAIGGTFVAGGFAKVFLLNLLPMVIHQIVGWLLIIIAGVGLLSAIYKAVK